MIFISLIVSRQKKTEDELMATRLELIESRLRLAEAQRLAGIGDWKMNINDEKLEFSEEALKILSLDREKFTGKLDEFLHLIHPEDRKVAEYSYDRLIKEKIPLNLQCRIKCHNGLTKYIQIWSKQNFIPGIKGNQLPGILQDISDVKEAEEKNSRLEAQMHHTQKLEALGTMAGGIAHDFNNILAAQMGYADLIKSQLSHDSKLHKYIDGIIGGGQRASDVVTQILYFSRQSEIILQPLRISKIIREAAKLIRASLPSSIEIVMDIDEDAGCIMADPTRIHQVIMNLSANALHAMQENGGRLKVSVENTSLDEENVKSFHHLEAGNYIKLTVKDSGYGMSEEILSRIFEPFFTTKIVGEGIGLGLSVVHGIVIDHAGDITVASEPGEGTEFIILFPELDDRRLNPVPKQGEPPMGNGEKILFVDDELDIVEVSRDMLIDLGYNVVAVSSSTKALEIISEDPDSFHLVITDLTMPVLPGDILAARISEIRKNMPVIICTGYAPYFDEQEKRKWGIRKVLQKPIKIFDLASTIASVLKETTNLN